MTFNVSVLPSGLTEKTFTRCPFSATNVCCRRPFSHTVVTRTHSPRISAQLAPVSLCHSIGSPKAGLLSGGLLLHVGLLARLALCLGDGRLALLHALQNDFWRILKKSWLISRRLGRLKLGARGRKIARLVSRDARDVMLPGLHLLGRHARLLCRLCGGLLLGRLGCLLLFDLLLDLPEVLIRRLLARRSPEVDRPQR